MAIPWGALATIGAAGLNLGGALYSGRQARAESSSARRFQEYMASTHYRRTMHDMRKAGLNPILAARGGIGAGSAPGAAVARIPDLSGIGSSAVAAGRTGAMFKAEKRLVDEQARTQSILGAKYDAEAAEAAARYRLYDTQLSGAKALKHFYDRHGVDAIYWDKGVGGAAVRGVRALKDVFNPIGKVRRAGRFLRLK